MIKYLSMVAILAILSGAVAAAQWYPGVGWGAGISPPGLTSEQLNEIAKLNRKYLEETSEKGAKLAVLQNELSLLINNPDEDWSNIEAKMTEMNKVRLDILKRDIEQRRRIWSFLSAEQKAAFSYRSGIGRGPCGLGLGLYRGMFGGGWMGLGSGFNRSRFMGRGRGPCRSLGLGWGW